VAMTIGSWQKELHHEQIVLDKIIAALRKKGDFKNAEKLDEVRRRLTVLAYQPVGGGGMVILQKLDSDSRIAIKNSLILLRERINETIDKLKTDGKIEDIIIFLSNMHDTVKEILMVIGHSDNAGKYQGVKRMSDAEIVLEKDNVDCPCGAVTQVNAKVVNTGSINDSFSVEFSEGGVDKNLVIEAWSDKKITPELKPRKSYPFVINIKPACSACGVSQVGLSDRVRITVESVLEEVDKDTVYLRVNVK